MSEKLSPQNFDQLASIESGYFWFQGRLLWVQSLIKRFSMKAQSSSSVYADLGCGTGQLAQRISESFKYHKTLLVDGHDFHLTQLTEQERFHFLKLDLESNFELDTPCDLITCLDVLEHLEKDSQFLKNVRRQLKPQGLLVLTVPAFSFLFSGWDKLWGHHRRYSRAELSKRLKESGFDVVFVSYFWSFLFPAAILRKIKKRGETEFPPVTRLVNQLLIWASQIELGLSKWLSLPIGTSVVAVARPTQLNASCP